MKRLLTIMLKENCGLSSW